MVKLRMKFSGSAEGALDSADGQLAAVAELQVDQVLKPAGVLVRGGILWDALLTGYGRLDSVVGEPGDSGKAVGQHLRLGQQDADNFNAES